MGDLLDRVGLPRGSHILDARFGRDVTNPYRLPHGDASFDVVVCRQGLQLFPDRNLVLSEMRRVLVPGGTVAVSVWGPMERSPAFQALARSLHRWESAHRAAIVNLLFSLSQPGDLRAILAGADLERIELRTISRTTRYPSIDKFVSAFVRGSPARSVATGSSMESARRRVVTELEAELAPWVDGAGLRVTTELIIGVARRAAGDERT
jgi:SAM-dependent methyltransferase